MFFDNPILNAVSQGAALGGALGASVGAQPCSIQRMKRDWRLTKVMENASSLIVLCYCDMHRLRPLRPV